MSEQGNVRASGPVPASQLLTVLNHCVKEGKRTEEERGGERRKDHVRERKRGGEEREERNGKRQRRGSIDYEESGGKRR